MIIIDWLKQPGPPGAFVAMYCKYCKRTDFVFNIYAIKPKDGDYFQFNIACPDHFLEEFNDSIRSRVLNDGFGSSFGTQDASRETRWPAYWDWRKGGGI